MDNVRLLLAITAAVCALTTLALIARMVIKDNKYYFPSNELTSLEELEVTGLAAFAYDTELNLCSKRAQKVLMDLHMDSPRKLALLTSDKLLSIKGCGPSTVEEIKVLASGFDIFIV